MDESSQKKKNLDAVISAISVVEKNIIELNSKFDRISEQLKNLHPAKMEVNTTTHDVEKKPEGSTQPQKPKQDVIYVRKSSEFSFYN